MNFSQEVITPETALVMLGNNIHNRRIHDKWVDALSADMKGGRWLLSHQAICFDSSGTLLDGQHRLLAVVRSGVAVPMMVVRGANPTTSNVLDQGRKRTFADIEEIAGRKTPSGWEATLRGMFTIGRQSPSISSLQELRGRYGMVVDTAMDLMPTHCGLRGINNGTIRGVVARALLTSDGRDVKRFTEVLLGGISSGVTELSAITLRNWLLRARTSRAAIYRKTERTLFAFLKGDPLTKIYESDEELFPIPGE